MPLQEPCHGPGLRVSVRGCGAAGCAVEAGVSSVGSGTAPPGLPPSLGRCQQRCGAAEPAAIPLLPFSGWCAGLKGGHSRALSPTGQPAGPEGWKIAEAVPGVPVSSPVSHRSGWVLGALGFRLPPCWRLLTEPGTAPCVRSGTRAPQGEWGRGASSARVGRGLGVVEVLGGLGMGPAEGCSVLVF